MSHLNKTTSSSFASGEQGVHIHEHAQPQGTVPSHPHRSRLIVTTDHVWKGHESVGSDLGIGTGGGGLAGSRQDRGGDRVLYTEKVTKEFDAHGNVVSQNVEHPKPGTLHGVLYIYPVRSGCLPLQVLDDDFAGRSGLTGSTGSSMGMGSRGRQAMVSDDYDRPGTTHAGNEMLGGNAPRERTIPGTQHSLGDKLACESQVSTRRFELIYLPV